MKLTFIAHIYCHHCWCSFKCLFDSNRFIS